LNQYLGWANRQSINLENHEKPRKKMLPSYMLRQLYVKGSLRNLKEGDSVKAFTFTMKNRLGTGTIKGEVGLTVDSVQIPLESITIKTQDQILNASEAFVSPYKFRVGDTIEFIVNREGGLTVGQHKMLIRVNTMEFGKAEFDVVDTISQ